MLSRRLRFTLITLLILSGLAGARIIAQDATPTPDPNCTAELIQQQQQAFATVMTLDFASSPTQSLDHMYKLGAYYQALAVKCGYAPSDDEITDQIDLTLTISNLQRVIEALAVGRDVDAIVAQLEDLSGDPLRGQLLFNGLEPVLDGLTVTCFNCHAGESAPDVVGVYTRVLDIRLQDPALADYTPEKYLVESIVDPHAYAVPDYDPNLMPDQFGFRLDIQMMSDIIAYLESQDQLPEDS